MSDLIRCCRCHCQIERDYRDTRWSWCDDCYYPNVEKTYALFLAMMDEGYRRIDAAVMSGWQDWGEACGYKEY